MSGAHVVPERRSIPGPLSRTATLLRRRAAVPAARTWPAAVIGWCETHFARAAALVLLLAAFNLLFRIDRELVHDWDESLYGINAWEAITRGAWIGTTFLGELDYYNSKPPLNAWLIAAAFKTLGPSLFALRIASAVSAWLTIAVLLAWGRRCAGAAVAVIAALVLTTTFGFLHVHSGRSANTDALFALLVLLTAVTVWGAATRPWRAVWLGPILAAAFLLKGAGVLLPLAVAIVALAWLPGSLRALRAPLGAAVTTFAIPVGAWGVARWSIDGPAFFDRMLRNDLIGITTRPMDGHAGSVFFYLHVLQKDHYDWLLAATVACLLFPALPRIRTRLRAWRHNRTAIVLAAWATVSLVIPTLMQTKLAWYLNPFYPVFALAVAASLVHGLSRAAAAPPARRLILGGAIVVALVVAEGKLLWYTFVMRDIDLTAQSLLIAHKDRLAAARIYRNGWNPADQFVLRAFTTATAHDAVDMTDFTERSRPGDFLVAAPGQPVSPLIRPIAANARFALYERMPEGTSGGDAAANR